MYIFSHSPLLVFCPLFYRSRVTVGLEEIEDVVDILQLFYIFHQVGYICRLGFFPLLLLLILTDLLGNLVVSRRDGDSTE